MKLNCDMGESFGCWSMGNDAAVMPWVDMANIACGFHASDPDNMVATIALAVSRHVEIGAHPGYDDKIGFGRRSIPHSSESISALVAYQVGALEALCQLQGAHVSYVKPHGALYNDMMKTPVIFQAILAAVAGLNQQRETPLALMILARVDNTQYQQWLRLLACRYYLKLSRIVRTTIRVCWWQEASRMRCITIGADPATSGAPRQGAGDHGIWACLAVAGRYGLRTW